MNFKMKLCVIFLTTIFLSGCASDLKAPCNEHAMFCGTKTKINQW